MFYSNGRLKYDKDRHPIEMVFLYCEVERKKKKKEKKKKKKTFRS